MTTAKVKQGAVKKKPTMEYIPRRELDIPGPIRSYCEEQGLVLRWINAVKFQSNGGYHKDYWVPFNFKEAKLELGLVLGAQDGFIRRGDTILGVRSKEIDAAYRASVKRKNARYNAAVSDQSAAEELKSVMRESGIKGRVVSGYDE